MLTEGKAGGYKYFLHDLHAGFISRRTMTHTHWHIGYEVFAVLEGEFVFQDTEGLERDVKAGSLLIVPARLRHATYRTDQPCLHVTLRFFTDPPVQPELPLQTLENQTVFQDFMALLAEADEIRAGWQERARYRLSVLLSMILSIANPAESFGELPAPATGITQQVDAYLRQHLTNPVTLDDVAAALNISVRSLIRQFKAGSGETVMKHLMALRMEAAMDLLVARPELTIKQVSAMIGILDNAYFCTSFRRSLGMSPQQYRRSSLVAYGKKA